MGRLLRWLEGIGLALWVCGLGASAVTAARAAAHRGASRPYLPVAGTPPLRFQAARPISRLVLPPLLLSNRAGAGLDGSTTNSAQPALSQATGTNRLISAVRVTDAASPPAPSQPAEGLPSFPAPDDSNPGASQGIDQRLLLEYLGPSATNGPARKSNKLSNPIFVPPVGPSAPRSSQATYQNR
ncbi:MAG: hypothetical protein ACLQVX_10845 [Limisphaerales bacterium]